MLAVLQLTTLKPSSKYVKVASITFHGEWGWLGGEWCEGLGVNGMGGWGDSASVLLPAVDRAGGGSIQFGRVVILAEGRALHRLDVPFEARVMRG